MIDQTGRSSGLATQSCYVRNPRKYYLRMTNLVTTVDVYSKSTLMTFICVVIVDKYNTSCHPMLLIRKTSKYEIEVPL